MLRPLRHLKGERVRWDKDGRKRLARADPEAVPAMLHRLRGDTIVKFTIQTTIAALQERGVADPLEEHPFAHLRRWRFDYCWPDFMIAWEIDGGVYRQGRHTRGAGYEADCVKLNEALLLGWRVLRTTTAQVESGQALAWLLRALGVEERL